MIRREHQRREQYIFRDEPGKKWQRADIYEENNKRNATKKSSYSTADLNYQSTNNPACVRQEEIQASKGKR
jgi:hypothetical protein